MEIKNIFERKIVKIILSISEKNNTSKKINNNSISALSHFNILINSLESQGIIKREIIKNKKTFIIKLTEKGELIKCKLLELKEVI